MTVTARGVIKILGVVLGVLLVIAVAGLAFFATADGEADSSDRQVSGAAMISAGRAS